MCDSESVRNSHPVVQTMTSGRRVSGVFYALLPLGQTILSTFYQLCRGPSGLIPMDSGFQVHEALCLLLFSPPCFFYPVPPFP